jgi:hypothetical protein
LDNNATWPVCTTSTFLLYDLSKDVGQKNNLAASNPAMVASMMMQLKTVRTNGGCVALDALSVLAISPPREI